MTVAAWLEAEAPRVLLATLTDRDGDVERVSSETIVFGGQIVVDPTDQNSTNWEYYAPTGSGGGTTDVGDWSVGSIEGSITKVAGSTGDPEGRARQRLPAVTAGITYSVEAWYEAGLGDGCWVVLHNGLGDTIEVQVVGPVGALVGSAGTGAITNVVNTALAGGIEGDRYSVTFDWTPSAADYAISIGPNLAADSDVFSLGIWVTGPPILFDDRILDADVEWRMGGALGRSGAANGGDLVLANPDAALDDWLSREWVSIRYRFGHPDWPLGDFITIFESRIDSVEANDETVSFLLRDRYVELGNPIQTIMPVPAPSAALLYPLCYGWPRNCSPIITEPNASPEYRVGEPPVSDAATTRYKNQAAFTTPGIAKINGLAQFDLDADPTARVTVDAKGKLNGSGTWIQKLGAALQDALTRTHSGETGILVGGSSTTVVLPETSSSVNSYYNGKTIRKWVKADAAVGDHTSAQSRTISAYVGSTRTATVSAWTTAAASGDVYNIEGEVVRAGPLTTDDLDTAAFTQFDSDYPYQIGLFIDDGSTTAVQMLDMCLKPGAYHTWTTGVDGESKLTIGILKDPSAETADFTLGDGEIHGDVERLKEVAITRKLRLGFLKNHTVSTESHDAPASRAPFAEEEYRWIAKGTFRPEVDPDEASRDVETLIVTESGAYTELDRLWSLMSVKRQIYIVQTLLKPLSYGLGSVVAVTDDRHELSGKKLVVVGIQLFPLEDRIELELWG